MRNCGRLLLIQLLIYTYAQNSYSQENDTTMTSIYNMSLEELMNTRVNIATKSEQPINETPSSVSVITAEEIKNMGARLLEDILQTVPGFELRTGFNGYTGIEVRGVKESRSSCRLLLMIDGTPTNEVMYGQSLRMGYSLNVDEIEKIEIIRGPGSALYGRNAFSAVINIITKNGKNSNKAFIKGAYGSYNSKEFSGFYGFQKKKLSTSLSLCYDDIGISDAKYQDQYGLSLPFNIYHKNISSDFKINFNNFLLSGEYYDLDNGATQNNSFVLNKIFNYSLLYDKNLNSKLSLRVKAYGHNEQEIQDVEQLKPALDVVIPLYRGGNGVFTYGDLYPLGQYLTPQFREYVYGFETETSYKFSDNKLMFGMQADKHGVYDVILKGNIDSKFVAIPGAGRADQVIYENGWFENAKHNYYNAAIYAQDIWYPLDYLNFTIGGRFDYDNEFGGTFSPRAGIVFEPTKNASIKLLYGKAFRAPAPYEQYATLGYSFGNKNLKPEIINTLEVVFNYRLKKTSHTLNLYRNQLTNMIYASARSSIDPNNVYKNIGKNISMGIEYEAKIYFSSNIYSYFNYSYTYSENTDTINNTTLIYERQDIAPHKINAGLNYNFYKRFNLNCNLYYRSKMKKYTALDLLTGFYAPVKNSIGDYAIINTTFKVNLVRNLDVKLSVHNALNKKFFTQDTEHWYQPPQQGRFFTGDLTYTF